MSAKKKVTKAAPKPDTSGRLIHANSVLVAENAYLSVSVETLSSECILLRSKVAALQAEMDAMNAGKHKKPGHCKHCGKTKIDHFYYTAKCKPNGGVSFEAAQ